MVSPSKRKKADRKGRETQTQTPLSNVNQADSTKKPTSKSSSRKPLATKKVYLDIRSATVLTKLEKDLKQLGAKVEPFLDTDIDYFVTDRPTLSSKCNLVNPVQQPTTPSPFVAGGPSPSPSPGLLTAGSVPSPSPGGGGGNVGLRAGQGGSSSHHHVTRSRAEAMLDCVRAPLLANDVTALNNSHTTVDPIENARAHNVPVYQVQQFVRWVEKLVERTRAGGSGGAARRVKVLNKEFLKLECARRRPEFRELKAWPTLRYEGTPGGPFETRGGGTRQAASGKKQQPQRQNNATGDQQRQQQQRSSRRAADRMTRKDTGVSGGGGGGGGYCEMCCLDYGDLSQHLASAGHLKLAQDPAHFAALDSLIRDACLDTLLGNGTTQATVTNHCGVVLSPLNVSDYTNNNKNNNSRRVLRSARASVAPPQNGVAAACAGMGNRTSSSSPTNGHHNTRSSQHRTAANSNAVVKVVAHSPNEVSNSPPAAAPSNVVANGIINHNHLTRLSVRTDLAAAIGGVGLATPTLAAAATPPPAQPTNDSEAGRTRQQQSGGGGGTSSRSSTCGESASAATCGQHLLRSKKQLRLPHALQGTTAEGEGGEEEGKRRRCKVRRRRRKRLSVEEKLIEDNRSYYKVEVLNSKLRSTGYYMSQRELELNRTTNSNRVGSGEHSVANSVAAAASAASVANSTNAAANSCSMSPPLPQDAAAVGTPEKQPVVMRFKKVRKSELSLLSDEAENFMFGDTSRQQQQHHHHLRSSDHDDDDDDEYGADEEELEDEEDNTTSSRSQQSGGGGGSAAAAPLAADESSQCSSASQRRRKRRTHAELFINDNLDYYKFDLMSGSRLRQGGGGVKVEAAAEGAKRRGEEEGGVMAHVKIKEEIKEEAHSEAEDEPGEGGEEEEYGGTADEVAFAFESAPVHESWYQTYRRQDEAREHHYTHAYHTYPRLRLPYEYRDKHKRRLLAQAAASGGKAAFAFKRRKKRGGGGGALSSGVLGKRGLSALDDKPRKSPRCHASTLAILSTLKYRRRRISPQQLSQLSQLSPTLSSAAASPSLVTPTKLSADDGPISRPTLPEDSVKVGGRRRRPVEDFVALADSLDNYFCEFYFENGGGLEDRYASTMQKLRDAWVECHSGGSAVVGEEEEAEARKEESLSPSSSKRLAKPKHSASTSSSDSEPHCCCTRDVDPSIFDDYSWLWGDFAGSAGDFAGPRGDFAGSAGDFAGPRGDFADSAAGLFAPGPQETDFLQLLAGYRQCNSMERALFGAHTINPKAVDSLRRNVMTSSTVVGGTAADSCASSECGGSSTGELLGFTEDGRMLSSKRRKRKKRNMTGWPKDKPKKLLIQQQLKMAAATPANSSSGCSRSLQKVTEEEGEEEEAAETSLVLKLRRPKDDAATADDDNSSCDVKVRRCRGLSLKDDAAIVDDDNSSGDVVKVRRCRGLSVKDDAAIVDDENGDVVKVRRCRGLSSVKDDAAIVDDDNSSGGDCVKVRRCRVVSVSEVDDNSDVLTRSVDGSSRRMRGALRRRAASMTSATAAGRRGRGRGGRGRGLRR